MTSVSVSYKGCVILAQAELVGRGGTKVPAGDRQYVPLAMVARAVGSDHSLRALELFRTKGRVPIPNPYAAMMAAIQYATDLVDAMVAGLAVDGPAAVGEFDRGGVHWRWDLLNVAHDAALTQSSNEMR